MANSTPGQKQPVGVDVRAHIACLSLDEGERRQ